MSHVFEDAATARKPPKKSRTTSMAEPIGMGVSFADQPCPGAHLAFVTGLMTAHADYLRLKHPDPYRLMAIAGVGGKPATASQQQVVKVQYAPTNDCTIEYYNETPATDQAATGGNKRKSQWYVFTYKVDVEPIHHSPLLWRAEKTGDAAWEARVLLSTPRRMHRLPRIRQGPKRSVRDLQKI